MSLPVPFFAVAEEEPSQSYIDEDEGDVINSLFLDGGDSSDSILNIHTQKAVEDVSAIDERSSSLQHEIVEDTAPMDPLSSHSVQQHLAITGVAVKEDVASPPATFLSQLPSVTAVVHEERRGVVGSGEEVVVNEEEKGDVNGEEVVVNEEEKGDVNEEKSYVNGEEVVVSGEEAVVEEKGNVSEEEKGDVNGGKGDVNEEEKGDVNEEEKHDIMEEEKHDIMEEEKGDGSEEKHDAIEEKNRDVMEEKHDATKEEQEKEDMKKITVEQTNGTSTTKTEQKEHLRQEKHPTPTPCKKKPLHKESKKTIPSMLHKEKTDELLNETQPSRIGLQERLQSRKNEKRSAIDARLSKLGIFGSVTTSDVWSMRWKS